MYFKIVCADLSRKRRFLKHENIVRLLTFLSAPPVLSHRLLLDFRQSTLLILSVVKTSASSMTYPLFVYGTLVPGRSNEHVLADIPGEWKPATVIGTLLQKGWGATEGYPGIVLEKHGVEVEGFLFSSKYLTEHWTHLDEFEGEDYERVLTMVTLEDGTTVDAYIYQLRT